MSLTPVNIQEKLGSFSDHWSPKVIARMNDTHFKLVKFQGDFVWHTHAETDEVFIVLHGEMRIDLRDGAVILKQGDMVVIPAGVAHKPFAADECQAMLVEPAGTVNTGDADSDMTADSDSWI